MNELNRHSDDDAIMKWFRLFIGVPSSQVTTAFALLKEHYTTNCRGCKEINFFFFDTISLLTGRYTLFPYGISSLQRFLVPTMTVKDTTHVLPA